MHYAIAYDEAIVLKLVPLMSAVLATAVLMFLAQVMEYAGLEYVKLAAGLALAATIGTFSFIALAIREFRSSSSSIEIILLAGLIGIMPFLLDRTLRLNGTQLNVHGIAMLGFLVYATVSELCGMGMLVALGIRSVVQARRSKGLLSR